MDIVDYLLFPFYVLAFFFLVKYRLKKNADPVLRKFYKRAFWIRVVSCFAFSIFLIYISPGDSFGTYYGEALNIYKQSLNDVSVIGKMIFTSAKNIDESLFSKDIGGAIVFADENNYMVVRVAAIFLFFSFGKYLIANLFFSLLAFEGCWRLYKFFYEQYPALQKQLAIAILYFPTFIFWSSGIGKEAICISGMGFITYGLYSILVKKKNIIASTIVVIFFTYILLNVKVYIIVSYLPFLIYFIVVTNVLKVKNQLLKILIGPAIVLLSILGFVGIILASKDTLGVYAIDGLTETVQKQQTNFQLQENISESNFDLGADYDGSILGLAKVAPFAIGAALFRPFIWEAKKPSTFLSSLESLALILFTIYVLFKVGPLQFFKQFYKKPIVAYCFFYSILFSVFVGATTLNFGSLVRYKIPCLPFYAVSMFLILYFAKVKKEKVQTLS
jgi:hypothetical protein